MSTSLNDEIDQYYRQQNDEEEFEKQFADELQQMQEIDGK